MDLFFVHPSDVQLSHLTLRDQEARHAGKVMRYRPGDTVFATDGEGHLYKTELIETHRNHVLLELLEQRFEQRSHPELTLCLGLIKKRDRMEFAVEKAVELGASHIMVFKGEYSQKEKVREDRLESTILAAMKQSQRVYLPTLTVSSSLEEVLKSHGGEADIIVADETSVNEKISRGSNNILLIVGPEGGFSSNETGLCERWNAQMYSLGNKRLRTETAAILMVDRFRNTS